MARKPDQLLEQRLVLRIWPRLRVFERPFPQGGTQPLFSVVNVDTERAGSPWGCPE